MTKIQHKYYMSYFAIDNVFHIDVTRIFVCLDDYVIHDLLAMKKGINSRGKKYYLFRVLGCCSYK